MTIKMQREATISVVVPVYNSAGTIGETIDSILRQSLKPLEIIIVDDGSTDQTSQVLKGFGDQITVMSKPNGGPASARNLGVQKAQGEFIAFTDSDCLPHRDWLFHLLRGFDDPMTAGVGGAVRSVDGGVVGEYVDLIRLLDPANDESGEIAYLITANACFRRSALIEAGLFDENFRRPGGEEAELCFRIKARGYHFRAVPSAIVLHHHRQSVRSLLKTLANYGEGAHRIGKLWPTWQIDRPARTFFRRLVSFRSSLNRLLDYANRYNFKKACWFSLLDYLRQPAFLWGYLRGQRRAT